MLRRFRDGYWIEGRGEFPCNTPKGGAIAFHHRFGGSLNLQVHFQVCVLDGMYLRSQQGEPLALRRTPPPSGMDLQEILLCVHLRVLRWLKKRRLFRDPNTNQDDFDDNKPQTALEACPLGSLGIGKLVAIPVEERESEESRASSRKSSSTSLFQFRDATGYSIHAGVVVHAGDSPGRERLFRDCSRPPLCIKRLSVNDDGPIRYRAKGPPRGKIYRALSPTQFLARLAALVPPPRHPLIRFHGVLAPHSADRKQVVPMETEVPAPETAPGCRNVEKSPPRRRAVCLRRKWQMPPAHDPGALTGLRCYAECTMSTHCSALAAVD